MRYTTGMKTNMTPQAQLRKHLDDLFVAGTGVMAFGVWTMAKAVVFCIVLIPPMAAELAKSISLDVPLQTLETVLFVAVLIPFLIEFLLRLYVGIRARAEGSGKQVGSLYLVVGAILAILSVVSSIVSLVQFGDTSISLLDTIMSTIIELTSVATFVFMIRTALRSRQLSQTLRTVS